MVILKSTIVNFLMFFGNFGVQIFHTDFEKTSGEILESLKWSEIPNKYPPELSRFFEISDGVKFAKYSPLQKDNIRSLD